MKIRSVQIALGGAARLMLGRTANGFPDFLHDAGIGAACNDPGAGRDGSLYNTLRAV